MAKSSKHTVILDCGNVKRKFCKIFFTGDGSYSITAPYHTAKKAVLFKATVNYDTDEQIISLSQTIDLSKLDEGRLKLTHHRSGFVQYSGDGVVSGVDETGKPKGLGVFSRPLDAVGRGPAIGLGVQDITALEETTKASKHDLVLDTSALTHLPGSNGVMLEAHYCQPPMRRFVRRLTDERHTIDVVHPAGFLISMPVILAPTNCNFPGLLGFELYEQMFAFGGPGYSFSGPGEKERLNEKGQRIADTLMCVYPRPAFVEDAKSLDYRTEGG